jgi:hypothetical protein
LTRNLAAKFVLRLPSQEQKEFHAEVAQDLLETAYKDSDFLRKVIIRDESWVYGCDPETNAHSSHWKLQSFSIQRKHGKDGAMSWPCRRFFIYI